MRGSPLFSVEKLDDNRLVNKNIVTVRASAAPSPRGAERGLAALWAVAFILLLPMLTYAGSAEVLLHQHRQVDPLTGVENLTRVRVYKCTDMMPPYVFYWFTSSTFVLGYLVPLVLIVFFNSRLIRKLYRHTKVLPRSGIPLRRIATYTVLIAVLYFVCWTPYWCSVLYAIYRSVRADGRHPSNLVMFVLYCVHLLPYFGSASNWILYGLLNTQLQVKHDVCATLNTTQANVTLAGFGAADDRMSTVLTAWAQHNGSSPASQAPTPSDLTLR